MSIAGNDKEVNLTRTTGSAAGGTFKFLTGNPGTRMKHADTLVVIRVSQERVVFGWTTFTPAPPYFYLQKLYSTAYQFMQHKGASRIN